MALDVKELQQLGASELVDKEKQLVQELFSLRFQIWLWSSRESYANPKNKTRYCACENYSRASEGPNRGL